MAKPREAGWVPRLPNSVSVVVFRIPVTRWSFASHLNPSALPCPFSACVWFSGFPLYENLLLAGISFSLTRFFNCLSVLCSC